jgi:multicomponent Na+:H+ antiporter subunit E
MNLLLLTLVLALIWATVTGTFSLVNLGFGALIGVAALVLLREFLAPPRSLRLMKRILRLFGLFLYELMMSAIRVAGIVLDPKMKEHLRPAIIAVPLDVESDAEITLLANMITLTPGTLSVDLSEDRRSLFVHVLTLEDKQAVIDGIKLGFEAQIREIFADDRT